MMKIVHVCLAAAVFNKSYAYQDNLLPKYHRILGHEVTIIAPPYLEYDRKTGSIVQAVPGKETISDGITLIRLKQALPCSLNQHIHAFWGLGSSLEKLKPDLVFVHGVSAINYRFFKNYKKKNPSIKIVYDNHTDLNNSWHNKLSYFYNRYFVKYFVVKAIVPTSSHFYGVTPARCDFLTNIMGVPVNKVSLLPMGADDQDLQIEQKNILRQDIREQYGIKEDDFLIVTGGKIDPLKNIHVLAEAVSNSKEKKIKMLIFGSIRDDLKDAFRRLESERIKCIEWVPSNEVYKYFYAADLVMFPGLHSVLWEQTVASRVPCAFSKIEGFEHVDIGGNCILMNGKTADYYQELVEKIYNDKDMYAGLLCNAQNIKSQQFLYSSIAQRVLDDIQ